MRTPRIFGGIWCGIITLFCVAYLDAQYANPDMYAPHLPNAHHFHTTVSLEQSRARAVRREIINRQDYWRGVLAPSGHYMHHNSEPQPPPPPPSPPAEPHTVYAGKTGSISPSLDVYFRSCSPQEFERYFDSQKRNGKVRSDHNNEIFEHYNLYHYSNFVAYIRTLEGYDSYIVNLEFMHASQKGKNERYEARHKVKHTEGFKKHGFAFWVAREAERIQDKRQKADHEVNNLQSNLKQCTTSQHISPETIDELFDHYPDRRNTFLRPAFNKYIAYDHEDDIAFFQLEKKHHADSPYYRELAELGEEYADECARAANLAPRAFQRNPDRDTLVRHIERMNVLSNALYDDSHQHRSYEISSRLQTQLTAHDIDHNEWAVYDGTLVQQHIHRELVAVAHDTAEVDHAFGKDQYISHLAAFVYRMSDIAHEHKKLDNIRAAYSLSDFCYSMKDACLNVSYHLRGAYLYTSTVVNTIEHIATRSLDLLAHRAGEITQHIKEHPLATAGELIGFAVVPQIMFVKTCFDIYQNHEALGTLLDKFKRTCSTDPAEATAQTIAFLVESIAVGAAQHKCTSLIRKGQKHATYFAKAAAQENKTARHLHKMGKRAAQHIELMAARSIDTLNIAMKEGIDATRKALMTLAKNKQFFNREFVQWNEIAHLFAQHPTPLCEINWHHILYPTLNIAGRKTTLAGYHFKKFVKHATTILDEADTFGITKERYFHRGYSKISSFFPKHWNEVDLIKHIKSAYNNIYLSQKNGFIGKSYEGVPINFVFKKTSGGAPKQLFLQSVFPVHEKDLQLLIKNKTCRRYYP